MAREYGGSDTVLLQDNVSLDGRGCLVFAKLLDAVGAGGARAKDLEDHGGLPDDGFARRHRGAIDKSIGVADGAQHLDFQRGTANAARLPPQLVSQQGAEGAADGLMCVGPAGHGDGLPPIKFIAQYLAFLPSEELFNSHRLADGTAHCVSLTRKGESDSPAGKFTHLFEHTLHLTMMDANPQACFGDGGSWS
jgi:hypothetical protein